MPINNMIRDCEAGKGQIERKYVSIKNPEAMKTSEATSTESVRHRVNRQHWHQTLPWVPLEDPSDGIHTWSYLWTISAHYCWEYMRAHVGPLKS